MRTIVTGIALACAVLMLTGNARAAQVEQALESLRANPPLSNEVFDFVVIADNQCYEPTEQPAVFKQMLREFNVLRPAFVVDVGDLILGGAADGLPPQWETFKRVISVCQPPFFPVPGNHDISDKASEDLWRENMGPTHYTFRYGNSLFVALNSEEVGALDRLPDAQVAWLKQELDAAKDVKNIFLFLHHPLFTELDSLGAPIDWQARWSNVADAIKGYPVKAVFSGHIHVYRDCGVRDGVHYVINGGAGVGSGGATEEEGDFNHYLVVRVRGDNVEWSVIRPGNVLPQDVVTSGRIGEMYNARNKWVSCEEVEVPYGAPCDRDVVLTIQNPHDKPFDARVTWEAPAGWRVTPPEASYTAPANGSVPLQFHVAADTPQDVRFPAPRFSTVYGNAKHGPPIDVAGVLPLTPVADVARAENVAIDGDFAEWARAQWVPVVYPSAGFDAGRTADLSCRMALMWDDANFYVATETVDDEHVQPYAGDTVWAADNIEFFVDKWHWGFTLTKGVSEVFLYEGVGESAEMVNTDVKLSVKRDGNITRYEAAIPVRFMRPAVLKQGAVCKVCMIMNDIDSTGDRHWLELMPGAGSDNDRARKIHAILK